jgi:hypothetical protein
MGIEPIGKGMQTSKEFIDEVPWFAIERRTASERRAMWRGGRRDTDWINRPPGALDQLNARPNWLATLRRRWVPGGESSRTDA